MLDNIDIIGQSRKEDEVQALVPIPAVKKIINIANNEQRLMTVTFSNKAIEFENSVSGYDNNDGVVKYTSRLIAGKFPNYKRVIPENVDGIMIKFNSEKMAKAVQRMSVVRDDNHGHGIVISQDGEGDVKLEGNNNQSEDCQELVGCDEVKIPEMFGMNAKYFKTALQAFNGAVLFEGSDTESPFLMRSYDGENNIKYVLMPMRA
jgi:DNA polymerase-3 subunit beta